MKGFVFGLWYRQRLLPSRQHPDCPLGQLGPINEYKLGVHSSQTKQSQHESDHLPKVKNAWINTSTPPYCLHGVMLSTGITFHLTSRREKLHEHNKINFHLY